VPALPSENGELWSHYTKFFVAYLPVKIYIFEAFAKLPACFYINYHPNSALL